MIHMTDAHFGRETNEFCNNLGYNSTLKPLQQKTSKLSVFAPINKYDLFNESLQISII